MKISKKLMTVLVSAVMLTTSCQAVTQKTDGKKSETTTASSQGVKAESGLVLKDQLDHEVRLAKPATKIASAYFISTSMLLALGLQDNLVGVEKGADKNALYQLMGGDLSKKTQIGSGKGVNLEELVSQGPELVIVPARLKEQLGAIEDAKVAPLVVNPETMEDQKSALTLLGSVTGKEKEAKELVDYISSKEQALTKAIGDGKKPKVYVAGNENFLTTPGSGMLQNKMVELSGGDSLSNDFKDNYWVKISREDLIAKNPEVIIIVPSAVYGPNDILKDPALKDVAAVKNQKVFQMPKGLENWDTPIPANFLGSYWIAAKIHPEAVSKEALNKEVKAFYEKFYKVAAPDITLE